MAAQKAYGLTRRQWLIQFAADERRLRGLEPHLALEAIVDLSRDPSRQGTTLAWAAQAYSNISQRGLERLIAEVARLSPLSASRVEQLRQNEQREVEQLLAAHDA